MISANIAPATSRSSLENLYCNFKFSKRFQIQIKKPPLSAKALEQNIYNSILYKQSLHQVVKAKKETSLNL